MKVFTKNDNGFVCQNCKKQVEPLKTSSRNHCPYCLHSLHVDINPGDRANSCRGIMKPVQIKETKKGRTIVFVCQKCGQQKQNICACDDDFDTILQIIKNQSKKNY